MKRRLVAALLLSTTPISISVSSSSSSSSNPNPNPNPTPPSPRYTPKPNSTPPPVAKCFYKVLKVPRTATPQQIKKAYRRRAVETHPDKNNGSRASFDLVAEAYECVSDPTTRQAYDRAGSVESYKSPPMQAGARNPNSPYSSSMSPENIFNAFFGGGAGSSSHSHSHSHNPHGVRRKHRDVVFRVSLTLEEMYAGVNSKRILIPKPHVNGSSVRKAVDVRVPIGAKVDGTFVLKGEINHLEDEGVEGGDAVFVFGQVEHERFVRKGDDLAVKVEISLFEALTGFRRTISSLDGREVRFKSDVCSNENKCVSDGDVRVVEGEGMPKGDGSFGNLFVELVVVMPDGGDSCDEFHMVLKLCSDDDELLGVVRVINNTLRKTTTILQLCVAEGKEDVALVKENLKAAVSMRTLLWQTAPTTTCEWLFVQELYEETLRRTKKIGMVSSVINLLKIQHADAF
ncbi:hypothetical protein ScalyP_jg2086 [Parmales sp. scaly parma]|nr:hypothetical protein ScalyP_jg2086 [Parmales sp. scaly parma]